MGMKKVDISRDNTRKIHPLPYQKDFLELQRVVEEERSLLSSQSAADYINNEPEFAKLYQMHQMAQKILNRMTFFYGNSEKYQEGNANDSIMEVFRLQENSNIVVFKMRELLPHKVVLDQSSGKMKYVYDRATLAARYRKDLNRFLKENKELYFSDTVFVWFENIIPAERTIDADNLDVKVFIDTCINKVFVKDDNVVNVHYAISGRCENTDVPYTIAYVGTQKNILRLMSE